jgi:NAD(P) transhydrogenase
MEQPSPMRFLGWSESAVCSLWVAESCRRHFPNGWEQLPYSLPTSVGLWQSCGDRVVTTVDIFGGFLITKRMLDLFKRPTDPPEYGWLYAIPAAAFGGGFVWAASTGVAGLVQAGYLVSTMLSIGALTGLSSQVRWRYHSSLDRVFVDSSCQLTARAGNALGMLGVAAGIISTLAAVGLSSAVLIQFAILVAFGGGLGLGIGRRVSPMQLPQTVAALHSVVGLAAVMTSVASVLGSAGHASLLHLTTAYLGVLVGGITFTGDALMSHHSG